jgi:hypothetical protein
MSPQNGISNYNLIKSQNDLLNKMITDSSNENTTYYQKSMYQSGDIGLLDKITNYLFIFYYICVAILVYYLFYDTNYSILKKLIIIAIFVSYPYVLNLIKYYLVKFVIYIYSVLNVNVYESGQW